VTTIDLHPEQMMDAARRGTLSAQAAADLRAHLDRCVACRMSLSLADDLRAEGAVTSSDGALLAEMVRGAMMGEPRTATGEGRGRIRIGRAGLTWRRVAVGLVLLLVGGSAGAGVWSVSRDRIARRFWPEIVELHHEKAHTKAVAPERHAGAASSAMAEPALAEPMLAPTPAIEAPTPPHAAHARVEVRVVGSADDLFAEANRERRAGDYRQALRRYAQLRREFPGSRQEMTARVVVGDLTLAEGSPREALASFDSYLGANPDGTLAEEARVGRALALMRLGRRDEERDAWNQLLRRHPDSVQGARARGRLAELQ
jgi:TolA-binding protein